MSDRACGSSCFGPGFVQSRHLAASKSIVRPLSPTFPIVRKQNQLSETGVKLYPRL